METWSVRTLSALLFTAVLAASCASSGGGLSREKDQEKTSKGTSQTVPAKPAPAQPPRPAPAPAPAQPAPAPAWTPYPTPTPDLAPPPFEIAVPMGPVSEVLVQATPETARVTVDGVFYGRPPVRLDSSGPAHTVHLTVTAPDYRTQTVELDLHGQNDTVRIDLEPILGTLNLMGQNLDDGTVTFGGLGLHPGINQLPVGPGVLRIHQFGFQDRSVPVTITENAVTTARVDLVPAGFSLSAPLAVTQTSQALTLGFRASGPGTASLKIQDSRGTVIQEWDLPSLTTWDQTVTWTYTDAGGLPVQDGTYTAVLSGGPPGAPAQQQGSLTFTVDRTLADRAWPSLGPTSGLLWVPTPEVLTPGSVQVGVAGVLHADIDTFHVPLGFDARFSPLRDWETEIGSDFRFWDDPTIDSYYLTFSVKRHLVTGIPGFRLAWAAGGTWAGWLDGSPGVPPTDFLTTFPALRTSINLGWTTGPLTILASPELDWSVYAPANGYSPPPAQGSHFWAYGRFGLFFDAHDYTLGISTVVRSEPFDQGFGLFTPVNFAFQATLPLPDSPVNLTWFLAVSAYGPNDWTTYGGPGITLLFPGPQH